MRLVRVIPLPCSSRTQALIADLEQFGFTLIWGNETLKVYVEEPA